MLMRRIVVSVIVVGAACVSAGPAFAVSGAPGVSTAARADAGNLPANAYSQLGRDVAKAWQITKGAGVTVAVMSTGVDPATAGLAGKVETGPDYVGLPHPLTAFGTLVAGLIAGSGPTAESPVAAAGIAPAARILSVRIRPDITEPGADNFFGTADFARIDARAIRYAVDHGAEVIYVEVDTGGAEEPALDSAVSYALSKNVVIVEPDLESGFYSIHGQYTFPASIPGVIGVSAVDVKGAAAPYSGYRLDRNQSVLIAAPGNSVAEAGPDGRDSEIEGPWAAAGWVTATVALVKSVFPDLSPELVARALELSARDRPPGGYNTTIGFGFVNPAGALREAAKLARAPGPTATASGPGVTSAGATFRAGSPLPPVEAVHHPVAKLAGFSAAIVAGLLLIAGAFVLRRRWAAGDVAGATGVPAVIAVTGAAVPPAGTPDAAVPPAGTRDAAVPPAAPEVAAALPVAAAPEAAAAPVAGPEASEELAEPQ